jgi:selenophosphate synthase
LHHYNVKRNSVCVRLRTITRLFNYDSNLASTLCMSDQHCTSMYCAMQGGMHTGDSLILTKAIGTGTLLAADMRGEGRGAWLTTAVDSVLQSSAAAAAVLRTHGATAATDVTGFGLAGHLLEMVSNSGVIVS